MTEKFSLFFKTHNSVSIDRIHNIQADLVKTEQNGRVYHRNDFSHNESNYDDILAIKENIQDNHIRILDKDQRHKESRIYDFKKWNKKYHIDIYVRKSTKGKIYLSLRGSQNRNFELNRHSEDNAIIQVDRFKSRVQFDENSILLNNITDMTEDGYEINSIFSGVRSDPVTIITIEKDECFSNIDLII